MFYSHEGRSSFVSTDNHQSQTRPLTRVTVLTSRKYGVATVWLVATLGSKSNLKKVSRKAILDVDVQKACETIVTPDAPMALRLQSNLLYGITRVYAAQCGYVLTDVEAARHNLRLLHLKVMRSGSLNVDGMTKARADQLVLQDDPNFLPDLDLAPINFDQMELDQQPVEGSRRSTLSPHPSHRTGVAIDIDSQQDVGGLVIPEPDSSFVGGQISGLGGFSDSGSGARHEIGGLLYEDDAGIQIAEDGNIIMSDGPVCQPAGPSARSERLEPGSASSRVRREHEGGQLVGAALSQPDDDGFIPFQDDYSGGPEAEPFPPRSEPLDQPRASSEESVEAAMQRRAPARLKIIPLDTSTELRNDVLSGWNTNYVTNMNEAARQKNATKAAAQAKKNAEHWIFGPSDQGPLSIFSGVKLLEALTGVSLTGEKRDREEDENENERRVRSRGEPSSDEVGRDEEFMPMMEDEYTIEQGRDAPTPLDDRHLSSIMPWSQNAGSRRPTSVFSGAGRAGSASLGGATGPLGPAGRRGSRLTSASPLMGHGNAEGNVTDFQLRGSQGDVDMTSAAEFELYGPAAEIDTQTAAQSQWQRAALDRESTHFFDFVQAGIENRDRARVEAAVGDEEDEMTMGTIEFESLLSPDSQSRIVAAQALLHVLALGTKNLISAEQKEPFGAIILCIL